MKSLMFNILYHIPPIVKKVGIIILFALSTFYELIDLIIIIIMGFYNIDYLWINLG